jgi:hypothetical protein
MAAGTQPAGSPAPRSLDRLSGDLGHIVNEILVLDGVRIGIPIPLDGLSRGGSRPLSSTRYASGSTPSATSGATSSSWLATDNKGGAPAVASSAKRTDTDLDPLDPGRSHAEAEGLQAGKAGTSSTSGRHLRLVVDRASRQTRVIQWA